MSKKPDGRKAINWLKECYERGTEFENTPAIVAALVRDLGMKNYFVERSAAEWDRQARYELLHENIVVTPPVPQYGYGRNPNASSSQRERSIATRDRDLATRERNIALYHTVSADQPDASPREKTLALIYEAKTKITQAAEQIADEIRREAQAETEVEADLVPAHANVVVFNPRTKTHASQG